MIRTISCRFMYIFCSLFTLLRVFGNCLAKQSKIRGSAHGQIRYSSIKRRTRHLKKIPKGLDPLEQAAIFSSDCLLWLEESTSQNEMINQNDYASFLLQFCLSSDFTGSRCIDTGDQLDFIALPKDIQLDFVTGLCPHDPVGKESCLNFLVSQEEQFGYSEFEGSYLCSTTYDLLIKNGLIGKIIYSYFDQISTICRLHKHPLHFIGKQIPRFLTKSITLIWIKRQA